MEFHQTSSALKPEPDGPTAPPRTTPASAPANAHPQPPTWILIPTRPTTLPTNIITFDQDAPDTLATLRLQVRNAGDVLEVELPLEERHLGTKLTRRSKISIPGGRGEVELDWTVRRVNNAERKGEDGAVDRLRVMLDRVELAKRAAQDQFAWLPDSPLGPAKQVTVPHLKGPKNKLPPQLYSWKVSHSDRDVHRAAGLLISPSGGAALVRTRRRSRRARCGPTRGAISPAGSPRSTA